MPVLIAVFAVGAYAFGNAPPRQRPHRQRGRDRPRRARTTEGTAQVYLGRVLADARHVPGRGARRRAPVVARSVATSSAATARDPRRRPGRRRRTRARPVRRLRVAADGPCRGRAPGAADPRRPQARRRRGRGHDQERLRRDAREAGRRARRAASGRAAATSRPAQTARSTCASSRTRSRSALSRPDRRPGVLRRQRHVDAEPSATSPPHDHRPADVRPDDSASRTSSRPTARSSSRGADDPVLRRRDRGPDGPAAWATSCTTCR